MAVFCDNGGTATISLVFCVGTFNSKSLQQQNRSRSSKMRQISAENAGFRRVRQFHRRIFSFRSSHIHI